ncbi:sulfatase [Nocardioides sp. C4-1]|uniref:sulfatase n=1 Tax=Nocardioides sp. C4-1 TaxID=3151851 RepID=UPI003264D2E7
MDDDARRPAPAASAGPSRRVVLGGLAAGVTGVAVGAALWPDGDDVPRSTTPSPTTTPTELTRPVEATRPGGSARRRNVVVISIDDLGWHELGCYGNTFNKTPFIDALAASGVRFTQAYSAGPICSPTRAALVTGLYPARTGITNFLGPMDDPSDNFLSPDLPSIAQQLGDGYVSGLIGKWHLTETYDGPYRERPGNPYSHGFTDVRVTEERYIGGGDYFYPYQFAPSVGRVEDDEYLTDRLGYEAVDFINDHRDEPFFLHLSNYSVHTELDSKPELEKKYAESPGADDPAHNPKLAGMLESVDTQVGTVITALNEAGIADRTLVVVISDNGGAYAASNAPLRDSKGSLYEGGVRVPFIAAWADGSLGPQVVDTPVSTLDINPTALELSGRRTRTRGPQHDGISLAPVVLGTGPLPRRDDLFWVFPHHFAGRAPVAAVRSGDLKLVMQLRDGSGELYDLATDPGETTDLAKARPGDVRRLRGLLQAHLRDVGNPVPPPGPRDYPKAKRLARWADAEIEIGYDGSGQASATPTARSLRLVSPKTAQFSVVSDLAPASRSYGAFVDLQGLTPKDRSILLLGLAIGDRTSLLARYVHQQNRVDVDLRVDGERVLRVAPRDLRRTVDLSARGARLGFAVGTDGRFTAYADQARGAGWEYLMTVDAVDLLDLRDDDVREQARFTVGARLQRASLTLGRLQTFAR